MELLTGALRGSMSELIGSFLTVFVGLFPIVNPLGMAPIFLRLTSDATAATRARLAWQIAFGGFVLMAVSLFVGSHILAFFGLTITAVQIAGGLVVMAAGWRMLQQGSDARAQAHHTPEPDDTIMRRAFFPLTMPLTRFANSVAEVGDRVDAVAEDVANYLGTDLLFYRAGHPEALVAREAAHWDPVLAWAANDLGAHFILSEGVVHVAQPAQAINAARGVFPSDPWAVAALHVVTTLTGSALLALALLHGVRDPDQVWAAAHVDEDWNAEKWGVDEEVAARRAARLVDFQAAVRILKELNPK